MSAEEKRAWVMLVVTAVSYVTYLFVVLGRVGDGSLVAVPYVPVLLWTVGSAIVATIVLNVALAIASPGDADRKDQRDREIYRFGEYVGRSFVVAGGVAALGMAMARLDHFWIANVIYLAFVLSSILGSAAKIVAYRRGFQTW
ncbi:hypothetical protein ACFQ08_11805 [Streptosporangium algeriense]|uniref:DUF2178 domain-containing protein n=1 Tax=Streptosporangium algeriense TaxID=1682748 RepID=A0ABW3DN86_9ACTN